MKVSELLSAARDELFKGWTTGTLMNESTGNVCAVGALRRATMNHVPQGSVTVFNAAVRALNAKAEEMSNSATLTVMGFNDHFAQSKQDVLDLFDKAAIGAEEMGN